MGIYDELSKLDEQSPTPKASQVQKGQPRRSTAKKTTEPSNHDTTIPRHHDTTASRHRDTLIELVRKAVKEFGKEAATHRFTLEEKKAIANIVFTYKNRNIRTSENEVTRVAINFIVNDYLENGENSILNKVLRALNE